MWDDTYIHGGSFAQGKRDQIDPNGSDFWILEKECHIDNQWIERNGRKSFKS